MSKEAKFTPGPWRVSTGDGYNALDGIAFHGVWSGDTCVATTGLLNAGDDDQSVSDAHLIAAAPDMYEALEKLLDKYRSSVSYEKGHDYDLSDMAESALAKARGES